MSLVHSSRTNSRRRQVPVENMPLSALVEKAQEASKAAFGEYKTCQMSGDTHGALEAWKAYGLADDIIHETRALIEMATARLGSS